MHCRKIVFCYTECFTHQHALLGLDVLLHAVVGCAVRGHGTHRTGEWGTSKSWVAVAIGLTQRISTQIQSDKVNYPGRECSGEVLGVFWHGCSGGQRAVFCVPVSNKATHQSHKAYEGL